MRWIRILNVLTLFPYGFDSYFIVLLFRYLAKTLTGACTHTHLCTHTQTVTHTTYIHTLTHSHHMYTHIFTILFVMLRSRYSFYLFVYTYIFVCFNIISNFFIYFRFTWAGICEISHSFDTWVIIVITNDN